jgi:hypothetical protein
VEEPCLSDIECTGVNDVRLTEKHTAELLVHGSSAFGVGMTIDKLRRHKSPGIKSQQN